MEYIVIEMQDVDIVDIEEENAETYVDIENGDIEERNVKNVDIEKNIVKKNVDIEENIVEKNVDIEENVVEVVEGSQIDIECSS